MKHMDDLAGFDLKSATVFPATFPDKGPDIDLRSAGRFSGGRKVPIFLCLKY